MTVSTADLDLPEQMLPRSVDLEPRQFVVTTKTDSKPLTWLDKFEQFCKALAIALLPIVLAAGGWWFQTQTQNDGVRKDYVSLAVSILKEPETAGVDPNLRSWAVELLNKNSPTKFDAATVEKLETGKTVLPPTAGVAQGQPSQSIRTLTFQSGQKVSGSGKNFSEWYALCSEPLPAGARIASYDFSLRGDRTCGSWAECRIVKSTSSEVCFEFRLQGHDELPPPGQRASEGVLSVTFAP
jgi:hypothetical protein